MEWLWAGGELLVGIIMLVAGGVVFKLATGGAGTQLSNLRFALVPVFFLIWFVVGVILILRGVGIF